jgi:hypothetical protein
VERSRASLKKASVPPSVPGVSYGKGIDPCLGPNFKTRLPEKEIGPFDLTVKDEKNQKEAVDMNKKAMCQFIQAFSTMSLLIKVNLQKKADKYFPSGRV